MIAKKIISKILGVFDFRYQVRYYFSFLAELGYQETKNTSLVLKDWIEDGIAFTNNDKVIVFLIDNRENIFITSFYEIQDKDRIPEPGSKEHLMLDSYLQKEKGINYTGKYTNLYAYGKEQVIKNTSEIMREIAVEIL